jgi:hypothetical protein
MAKIFRSSVINAPIDEVWARIRNFNALPDWQHYGWRQSPMAIELMLSGQQSSAVVWKKRMTL